ncbi:DNA gyrase subunit A [Bacillus cereus]|nr:DNA gyrase subunit A [Bacillus cereus]
MAHIRENIVDRDLHTSVRSNFLEYSMMVIKERALPDVRDGLKPVHRRIVYAMQDLNIVHSGPHKKSARVVGEVIGKYHPHGDSAVYEAMVRMAQDFKLRYPLIDGQGYFGSLDGDKAAAMRYTEAKMTVLADELLRGINDNTVDFKDNYDGTESEPKVLPSRFPNLLVNGSEGIAVGMATGMAPHCLTEVIDGIIAQINNPDISIEELMTFIKGPDFPTGATVYGIDGIKMAYATGRGKVTIRATTDIIENKDGSMHIEITDLPYMVNKKKLIEKIWEMQLLHDQNKDDITKPSSALDFIQKNGIHDISDSNGIKILIKLKKSVMNPQVVVNRLYTHTPLQTNFNFNNVALIPKTSPSGEIKMVPATLNLKELITHYIAHQLEVTKRHIQSDLNKAEIKMHLLNGLSKALDNIDETIAVIRSAKSREEAISSLEGLLSIARDQAISILEKRIQALAGFEQMVLRNQHAELEKLVNLLKSKLADDNLIYKDIVEDLHKIRDTYGDERRTKIIEDVLVTNELDLIPDEEVLITLTNDGYIKSSLESSFVTRKRNGKGTNAMSMYDGDYVKFAHVAKSHDKLLFFTNTGRVFSKYAHEIPKTPTGSNAKGKSINLYLELDELEKVQNVLSIREFKDNEYLFFTTVNGQVKKTPVTAFSNIRRNGMIAISLNEGDKLVSTILTKDTQAITLIAERGKSITFGGDTVRPMSRITLGMRGMTLAKGDKVVSAIAHEEDAELLIVTNEGYGKRTPLSDFHSHLQKKGGQGILAAKLTEKSGKLIDAVVVRPEDEIMTITKQSLTLKVRVSDIQLSSRISQGLKLINLREDDEVTQIARIFNDDSEESSEE